MKTILVIMLGLALSSQIKAQEEAISLMGKNELSPALSFQVMKDKGADEGTWYVILPLRWTYFVSDQVGVGAELLGTLASEESGSAIIFSGIFEYDFIAGRTLPFLTLGAGISNGSFQLDRIAFKVYDNALGVFTLGAGVKVPVSNNLMVRMDMQYRQFRGKDTYEDFWEGTEITEKIRTSYFTTAFGVSILL